MKNAAAHHRVDAPGVEDIGQRVAVQQHEVGLHARGDAANVVAAEQPRAVARG
jgi:hypothetical protein